MKRTLKTFVAVVCAALTLTFASCTKDAEDLIIGSWQAVEELFSQQGNDEPGVYVFGETEEIIFTFDKDRTLTTTYKWLDDNGQWRTETQQGSYSVKDNKLTIIRSDNEESEDATLDIDYINNEGMMLSQTTMYHLDNGDEISYTDKVKFKRI